jgi:hypothetical protein
LYLGHFDFVAGFVYRTSVWVTCNSVIDLSVYVILDPNCITSLMAKLFSNDNKQFHWTSLTLSASAPDNAPVLRASVLVSPDPQWHWASSNTAKLCLKNAELEPG